MTPQISVVIVNYNSGAALASTLESLSAGLAGLKWDAVVVDNASTHHSERAAQDDQSVRLVRQHSNVGFAAAVNIGTAATSRRSCWCSTRIAALNPARPIAPPRIAAS